jgi:hypothetical protein
MAERKFMKHLGDRYEVLSGWKTANLIIETMKERAPLTSEQERVLKDEFGDSGMLGNLDMPFLAYSWKEEKKSGSFGWRLTMPVFFILVLLMYIFVLPIKWILTGYFGFKQEEKLGQFFVKWYQKIYNERW